MVNRQDFDLSPHQGTFLVLHVFGGQLGLPVLVGTALLNKRVHMNPALLNFLATWIIYSFSYCLLIYSNQAHVQPRPAFGVCLTQAAMINGSPPMCAMSCLILVVHVWSTFHDPEKFLLSRRRPWVSNLLLLGPPYFVYLIFATGYAITGALHPDMVDSGHGVYCTLSLPGLGAFIPAVCLVMSLLILGFEVAIVWNFVHRWYRLKKAFPLAERRRPSRSLSFRVAVFSLYSAVTAAASLMLLEGIESPVPYMIQASLPLAAFVTFATTQDIVFAWFPWERPTPEKPSGDLVVDRKMSSGMTAHAFPASPMTPTVHVAFPWPPASKDHDRDSMYSLESDVGDKKASRLSSVSMNLDGKRDSPV